MGNCDLSLNLPVCYREDGGRGGGGFKNILGMRHFSVFLSICWFFPQRFYSYYREEGGFF